MTVRHHPSDSTSISRRALLVLLLVVLVCAGGCKNRRSALRPVYIDPPPTPLPTSPSVSGPTISIPSNVEPMAPIDLGTSGASGSSIESVPRAGVPESSPPVPAGPPVLPKGRSPGEPSLDLPREEIERSPVQDVPSQATPPASAPSSYSTPLSGPRTGRRETHRVRLSNYTDSRDLDDLIAPPKASRPWKYIVIHHSADESGGLDQIDRDHRERLGTVGCGYHFVIGNGTDTPDGRIEIARRWADQKAGVHCRDARKPEMNEDGIGICLVGDFATGEPTTRQLAATRALVDYLSARYSIPPARIGTHAAFANTPTTCPGRHFPATVLPGAAHVAGRL